MGISYEKASDFLNFALQKIYLAAQNPLLPIYSDLLAVRYLGNTKARRFFGTYNVSSARFEV